jgi:hypothetical protein
LRNQSFHPLPLLLAVSAHIGLVLVLGNGTGVPAGEVASQRPLITTVALLTMPENANTPNNEKSSAPAQVDTPPNYPVEELPYRGDSASEGSGTIAPSPEIERVNGHEENTQRPAVTLPPATEPYYYLPSELTEAPVVVKDISPRKVEFLPDLSRRPRRVHLLINEQGEIDQVIVEDTSLSQEAKQFIEEAFSTVKFNPGKLGNLAVKSELSIEVTLEQVLAVPVVVH